MYTYAKPGYNTLGFQMEKKKKIRNENIYDLNNIEKNKQKVFEVYLYCIVFD